MHRRQFLVGGAGAVAAGAIGVYALAADGSATDAPADPPTPVPRTATAPVTRGDLADEREFRASVSFGEPWPLGIDRTGTVTAAVAAGAIIEHGDELVRIDERAVFLAEGEMPMYRTLERVDTRQRDENNRRLTLLEGPDVIQLQTFLASAGHDADGRLEIDGVFGSSTEKAAKAWQDANGLSPTGRVDSGQLVFTAEPVRIASTIRTGAGFQSLEVTRADALILVDTSNRDRGAISPGTAVTIVLPDGGRVAGEASKQEQATNGEGAAVWRTTIRSEAILPSEVGTATIEVVDVAVEGAVLVPASALLALAEGGFAVEKTTDAGPRLTRVDVVDVLDGMAAVTGDIAPGDTVVVPT
ncbi:MAG: peptidoglycan-binding domain-containing protein [Actinomycetota bacterium]